ncbi:TonB family protein [uncultured Roseovarius sp.]|uniref:TonB family protein n=1 Tax=uncultured Roseovarius sp. TaxID=293344 RepID=UPI00263495C9|nr:TonB family protein [uncultured Roseovarius sp.]
MIRRSILVATVAFMLSLLVHGLGLNFTTRNGPPSSSENAAADLSDVGGVFEDFAEAVTETEVPEPAPVPDPPSVTSPEPVDEQIPTSQALVASDNPQDVLTPDTGDAEVTEPDAAEPSERDATAPGITAPSGGEDETNADVTASQTIEAESPAELPEGDATGSVDPSGAQTSETETSPSNETVSTDPSAPDPSPRPAITVAPEVVQAELPETTVETPADEPEILSALESEDGSSSAVTRSLRPPAERPSAEALGVPEGAQRKSAQQGRATGVIESPLAVYKRSSVDLLAFGSGGARSGSSGFSGSRGPGNSSTTNYVGRVLVQLNRAPILYASVKGMAQVSFEINPDGTLAWVRILNATGSQDIRRAASAQVRSAAPFPRPPQGSSKRLAFVYRN